MYVYVYVYVYHSATGFEQITGGSGGYKKRSASIFNNLRSILFADPPDEKAMTAGSGGSAGPNFRRKKTSEIYDIRGSAG